MAHWRGVLDEMVRERRSALVAYACLFVVDRRDAEDLVHDAIVRTFARPRAVTEVHAAEGYVRQAIRTVFHAIHEANPSQKVLAYQYLQALPQIANGTANKVWIVPTELTRALEGMGGALGGLANMVGDLPSSTVDAGAVEREAAEAAEAAAAEAERVNAQVRAAEAQVSGDRAPKSLTAPDPVPPAAALGSADYNNAGEPERA